MKTQVYKSLPNLPGYKAHLPLEPGDRKHYKKTTLCYLKGYAVDDTPVYADIEPGPNMCQEQIDDTTDHAELTRPQVSPALERAPKWIENDRKVLRWYAYFKEAVPESPQENYRVRQIVICYYLTDDTIELLEPRTPNSGIWQGSFLKRHRVPKPDGTFYKEQDIRVAENVCMYARVFRVIDADEFTRGYLSRRGTPLGPAEKLPVDPYTAKLNKKQQLEEGKAGLAHTIGLAQQGRFQAYLLNSMKVLRFYCVWDDRQSLYGDRRPLRLLFYLDDGTVEILEYCEPNSGRDPFPVFLQRGQLPKDPRTTKAGRNLDKRICFGLEDFRIGEIIPVYGRRLFIFDCDDFTREWMQENMGYSSEMMATVDIREPIPEKHSKALPPYNGYGSLADSAENCKHLVPRPPKKDFYKLISKGKIVLRFGTRFADCPGHAVSEENRQREFVMSYFMSDDSIAIFEHPTDGFPGGKFLERGPVPKGNGELITDQDLYVGADLSIYKRRFQVESADEYTMQYMENNRHDYVMADWEQAVSTAKGHLKGDGDSLRAATVEVAIAAQASISTSALAEIFVLAGIILKKHQVISIYRRLHKTSPDHSVSAKAVMNLFGL